MDWFVLGLAIAGIAVLVSGYQKFTLRLDALRADVDGLKREVDRLGAESG